MILLDSSVLIELFRKQKKEKSNKLIDLADLLIGATAVAHGYKMATLNRKHFDRIPNLQIL